MNRHHPYGGSFESPVTRRGGSPSGPGPDRSHHRFQDRGGAPSRGRGFGRGRGYGGNYDLNMSHDPYDQGQSQGDVGAYNSYEAQAGAQNSFYQSNYGPPAPYAPPSTADYNQDLITTEGALET
jgi:transcription initiation factor TFIID subunit 15